MSNHQLLIRGGLESVLKLAAFSVLGIALVSVAGAAPQAPEEPTPEPEASAPEATPQSQPAAPTDTVSTVATEEAAEIKPRFELHIPSVHQLSGEIYRSHAGPFVSYATMVLRELASGSTEGFGAQEAELIIQALRGWPDTSIDVATFAADREGRARWAIRFGWKLEDLRARVETLLSLDAAADLLEGIELRPGSAPDAGFDLGLGGESLAKLLPGGESHSYLASHADLTLPEVFTGAQEAETDTTSPEQAPILAARLNLTGTEKDTGATFFSQFNAVTAVDYTGQVDASGDWVERLQIHWPPIFGMGAKVFFGRVKDTFWVPDDAFGGGVFSSVFATGLLDAAAGFSPQVMREAPGKLEIVGEAAGPIGANTSPQVCVTILPGSGFLPVPDVVLRTRTKNPDKLLAAIRSETQKRNGSHRQREQPEPWHEVTVRGRPVFWSDATDQYPGTIVPFVVRSVLFVDDEKDAKDRQRSLLVLGLTTTSPEELVKRWLDATHSANQRSLPTKKTNGQACVQWKQVYRWIQPYIDFSLSSISTEALLPARDAVASDLTDTLLSLRMTYSGLKAHHQGPFPVGILLVPVLFAAAAEPDEDGESDLARERLASQRLKVLYHHSKLFEKDMGRWPAEVAELDGYVDFAGNPELLKLSLSSQKRWGLWFDNLVKEPEKEETDASEDGSVELDDDLYVIAWSPDSWRLGIAPGTLEHIEKLYVDKNGRIHREEKQRIEKESSGAPSTSAPQKE